MIEWVASSFLNLNFMRECIFFKVSACSLGGLCATVQLPFHSICVKKQTSRTKTKQSSQHLHTHIWRVSVKLVASVGGRYDRATAGQRTDKDGAEEERADGRQTSAQRSSDAIHDPCTASSSPLLVQKCSLAQVWNLDGSNNLLINLNTPAWIFIDPRLSKGWFGGKR